MSYVRESVIENHLVKVVKKAGGIAYKFVSPGRIGVPDRLCIFPHGLACFVECKAPGRTPSAMQELEHRKLRELGHAVYVLDTKDSIDNWIAAFTGTFP